MSDRGYVFTMNRNRDGYQVPLALHEAGLLRAFVSDFYAPGWLARRSPALFRRRHHFGLATAHVRHGWLSFVAQYGGRLLGFGNDRLFPISDRLLAAKAARVARSLGAPLYAYASYIPPRGKSAAGRPVISFEYHPHPAYALDILERDFARFPQVRYSIEEEREAAAQQLASTSWQAASHIVCASGTTLRSLEFVGCPRERCTIIPYGVELPPGPQPQFRGNAQCQFLFVGQGIQRKGLHHLLLAWRQAALGDAELTLVCYRIDPGIEAMVGELAGAGLPVRLLRRQSPEELHALYRRSDVFAMPSLVEGFGLVYLEALVAGCHVIATANTGVADLGLDSGSATLVEPGDIDHLAQSLIGARDAWRSGRLNPAAIAADAGRRTWSDFRREIAAHARAVLDQATGFSASSS